MFKDLFKGLFDTAAVKVIPVEDFLLCLGFALVCALLLALEGDFSTSGWGAVLAFAKFYIN